MTLSISEILEHCAKLGNTKEKIAWLQQNDSLPLRVVLQYALDPRVEWILPKGIPPYKPNEALDQYARLYQEIRKVQYFVKGDVSSTHLHPVKREAMFIEFIESLDPKDALLMCAVKDKKIPYKGITPNLVNQAFPGIIFVKEK